jgi:hypothetical protein
VVSAAAAAAAAIVTAAAVTVLVTPRCQSSSSSLKLLLLLLSWLLQGFCIRPCRSPLVMLVYTMSQQSLFSSSSSSRLASTLESMRVG